LVCLENTSNRGGGSCYDFDEIKRIRAVCDEAGLLLHLDGARLFNALVAKNETARQYGNVFDSISICLNKGLGCPIGSILIGRNAFIKKARRIRKVLGGGMRQAGYMAACGVYALQYHVERLKEDHQHALQIADALCHKSFVGNMLPVETNIILFKTKKPGQAGEIVQQLVKQDILAIAMSPDEVRFVLHLDITRAMIEHTLKAITTL